MGERIRGETLVIGETLWLASSPHSVEARLLPNLEVCLHGDNEQHPITKVSTWADAMSVIRARHPVGFVDSFRLVADVDDEGCSLRALIYPDDGSLIREEFELYDPDAVHAAGFVKWYVEIIES